MSEFTRPWAHSAPLLDSWMKSVNDFWSDMVPVSSSEAAETEKSESASGKSPDFWKLIDEQFPD